MLLQIPIVHSFLLLSSIPLNGQNYSLFIYKLVGGHLGSFHFEAIKNKTAMNL